MALSPNGRIVATDFVLYEPGSFDPDCQCLLTREIARYVDYANHRTEKTLAESQITGLDLGNPSWIDSSRVLMTTYGLFSPQVFVGTKSGGEPTAWYRDPDVNAELNTNQVFVADAELSRAGDRLAVMRRPLNVDASDTSAGTIQILSVSGLTTPPTPRCTIGPGRRIGQAAGPTWSPDDRTLAWWEEGSGIYATRVTPAADCGLKPRLIVRGAQEPDSAPRTSRAAASPDSGRSGRPAAA